MAVIAQLRTPSLFGSRVRERLLCLLCLIPEIHIRGAAAVLGATPSEIAKAVASLERVGAIASRRAIGSRLVSLNPRWYAAAELRPLLSRMSEAAPELTDYVATRRTRPRRTGKPL